MQKIHDERNIKILNKDRIGIIDFIPSWFLRVVHNTYLKFFFKKCAVFFNMDFAIHLF